MESETHEPMDAPPDPLPEPTPDQLALGLRRWVRRVATVLLSAALLVVVIRGIYVVWQVTHQGGQ